MWLLLCTTLLLWPMPDTEVVRPFEPPPRPWAAGHRGVDLAGVPGQQVRALRPGVVSFAGSVAEKGVVSIVLDDSGTPPLRITYESLRPEVTLGDRVSAGQMVGRLRGETAHCGGRVCLHWGLRRGQRYLDPLLLVRAEHPVLLPMPPAGQPPPSPGAPESSEPGGSLAGRSPNPKNPALAEEEEDMTARVADVRPADGTGAALGLLAAVTLVAGASWARRRLSTPARLARSRTPRRQTPTFSATEIRPTR